MDHESFLRLLGLATARGQQLELVTAQILAKSLRVSESTGRLLATTMGLGGALAVLQTLVSRGEGGSFPGGDLDAWLPMGKAALEA